MSEKNERKRRPLFKSVIMNNTTTLQGCKQNQASSNTFTGVSQIFVSNPWEDEIFLLTLLTSLMV